MVEVNKVDVGFSADVSSFNRGVDRMERKLEHFDKTATKSTERVGKRFDFLDGELRKVEKTMGGFGDDLDLNNVQKQLEKAKQEFNETGKVGERTFDKLNKSVNKVDFSTMPDKAHKAFSMVQKDVVKLGTETNKLNRIQYANGFTNENKLIASSFADLDKAMNNTMLSFDNASKHMNSEQLQKYVHTTNNARHSLFKMKQELEETGKVSNATFYKVNEDMKKVNFNQLNLSAQKAVKNVSKQFNGLTRTFDTMGTNITKNQNRIKTFSKVSGNSVRYLKNSFSDAMITFNRWGTVFRNMQEVGEHVFGGVLRPLILGLVPVAGTAITAIMGIGAGLAAVGGGAIGLGGAFGIAGIAIKAFTGQATTALEMLEDGQLKVTNEVKRYQSALKGLQDDWKSLISQNQARIFNTMSNGIDMARYSLKTLNPFLVKTAEQIEKASAKMHRWVTSSKNATNAFKMLNKIGPPIFQNILNSAGHVGNGITRIFTAFGPLFTWTGQGLEKLSKKFDIWANSKNTQRGIASFIDYTKSNLPILGSIFGNTFLGIIELFKAFSGQTTWALKGLDSLTAKFKNWAATLDETQGFKDFIKFTRDNAPLAGQFIANLTNVIVQLIKAMAPISVTVLRLVTNFLGWLGAIMKVHPWVGKLIGSILVFAGLIKSGLFIAAMINSFTGLSKAITLLIGTQKLQIFWQKVFNKEQIKSKGLLAVMSGWYSGLIGKIKAFSLAQMMAGIRAKALAVSLKIQAAAMAVWSGITKGVILANKLLALSFKGIGRAIMGIPVIGWIIAGITALVGVIMYLWRTNESFRNGVIAIWNSIKQAAINVFGWLKPYLQAIWNGIKFAAVWAWNAIKVAAVTTWNAIKFAILHPIQALKVGLSAIWAGIKFAAVWAWNAIKTGVMFVINAWLAQIRANFNTLKSFFSAIWNGIKFAAIWAWNAIKLGVMTVIRGWIFAIRTAFAGIKSFFSALWNGIKASAIWIWNAIKNGVMLIIRGWIFAIRTAFAGIRAFFTALWNGIKATAIWAWNGIKNGVMFVIRGWITAIRVALSSLRKFFTTVWNGIKNVSLTVWRAIKNGVLAAIRALSTGVRVIIGTLRKWIVTAWNYIKNRVVALARAIWTGVRTAFNNLGIAIRKIVGTLRTWLIKAWTYIKNRVVALTRSLYTNVRKLFTLLWNSIKRTITTLRTWIIKAWTYIKNKVVALARNLYINVRKAFTNLWNAIKRTISTLRNWLIRAWRYIRDKVVATVRHMSSVLKKTFSSLWSFTKNIFSKLRTWLINLWKYVRNKVVSFVKNLWSNVKRTWSSLWGGTRSIFNKVRSFITSTWSKIKNSVVGTVKKLWSSVKGTFNTMSNGLKSIIGKIKGHINGMVTSIKKGLNKLISGVNWVGNKLGMGKQMIKPFKLSTGTSPNPNRYVSNGKINQDTMAIVGDKGRGNGRGGYRNETITYPNGKKIITPGTDTMAYLPKGSTVESGAQTQANGVPQFNKGTLPRFNAGSFLKKKGGQILDGIGDGVNAAGHKTAKTIGKGVAGAKKIGGKAVGIAKDLFEYAENPGKLVDLVLSKFGVNFDFVKGDIMGKMMKGAFKKLKGGVKGLFKSWLEDSGGADLSSFDKYAKTTPYSPNKAVPGYSFNGGRHYGIDYATPSGHTITAPTTGTVSKLHDNGGGNVAKLLSGKFTQFFLHLNKVLKTGKVKQGEKFAQTGNSGAWTTGPHLHYQVEKGNSPFITNKNTIDPEKFASMGGGGKFGKGSAAARKIIKRAQSIMGGKFNTPYVTDQMMRLAKRESNFDPNAVNNWDINARNGNPSRGMFQMIKTTFDASKTKGRNNYKNPIDQAVAVLNYINKRYSGSYGFKGAFKRAADYAYASGGFANFPQMAWLAEGGFSESIISHDPANKVKSKAIHDRTGEMLGFNEDVQVMRIMADLLRENNAYQEEIASNTERTANKSSVIEMNGRKVAQEVASDVNKEIKRQDQRNMRMKGKI